MSAPNIFAALTSRCPSCERVEMHESVTSNGGTLIGKRCVCGASWACDDGRANLPLFSEHARRISDVTKHEALKAKRERRAAHEHTWRSVENGRGAVIGYRCACGAQRAGVFTRQATR